MIYNPVEMVAPIIMALFSHIQRFLRSGAESKGSVISSAILKLSVIENFMTH